MKYRNRLSPTILLFQHSNRDKNTHIDFHCGSHLNRLESYNLLMMSENIASEFVSLKEYFISLGYEVIGTKDVNDETIIFIKEKKK